jgi:GTPase SAR1 family protein
MKDSFDNIKTWKAELDRYVRTHKFLVGNKADLGDDRCIVRELAEVFNTFMIKIILDSIRSLLY